MKARCWPPSRRSQRPYAELEAARIEAGISDAARDGWAGYLPQEVGLEGAVSYRKGCYVGQEIMARLEARGNARYHLAQLLGEGLPAHAEVTFEGKLVGRSGAEPAQSDAGPPAPRPARRRGAASRRRGGPATGARRSRVSLTSL